MSLGNPPSRRTLTAQEVAEWLDASADWIAERSFTDLYPDLIRKRLERLNEVIDAKLAGFEAELECYDESDLPSPSPSDVFVDEAGLSEADTFITVRHEHVTVADVIVHGSLPPDAVGVEWLGRFQSCRAHAVAMVHSNMLPNELEGHVLYDEMIPPNYHIDCAGCAVDPGVLGGVPG